MASPDGADVKSANPYAQFPCAPLSTNTFQTVSLERVGVPSFEFLVVSVVHAAKEISTVKSNPEIPNAYAAQLYFQNLLVRESPDRKSVV